MSPPLFIRSVDLDLGFTSYCSRCSRLVAASQEETTLDVGERACLWAIKQHATNKLTATPSGASQAPLWVEKSAKWFAPPIKGSKSIPTISPLALAWASESSFKACKRPGPNTSALRLMATS